MLSPLNAANQSFTRLLGINYIYRPCSEIAASLLPALKIYDICNVHYRICSTGSNFGTRPIIEIED